MSNFTKHSAKRNRTLALEARTLFDGSAIFDAALTLDADDGADVSVSDSVANSTQFEQAAQAAVNAVESNLLSANRDDIFASFNGGLSEQTAEWNAAFDALSQDMQDGSVAIGISFADESEMNGAFGAFAADGAGGNPTIYLNRDWIENGADSEDVTRVIVEEIGHFLDYLLNGSQDTAGDEGELFAASVLGLDLSGADLSRIQAEDDSSVINVNGLDVAVEQSAQTVFDNNRQALDFSAGNVDSNDSAAVGNGYSVGDKVVYEGVTTIDGVQIDAIIETVSFTNGTGTAEVAVYDSLTRPIDGSGADPYWQPTLNLANNERADFSISFYRNDSGTRTAVTLQNVVINSYDIDYGQYQIFEGLRSYDVLSSGSNITASTTTEGYVKFTGVTSAGNNRTSDRVEVFYDQISTFNVAIGTSRGSSTSYFAFDFSEGDTSWSTTTTGTPAANLSYNTDTFIEHTNNDGSISNDITITLTGDTFAALSASDFSNSVTISNVPAGLTATITRDSATQATLTLTGTATSHAETDDVNNLSVEFSDTAFVGGDASKVTGYLKNDVNVDFTAGPPAALSIADITVNEGSPYAVFVISGGTSGQAATLSIADGTTLSTMGSNSLEFWNGTAWQSYSDTAGVMLNVNGKLLVRTAMTPEQEIAQDNGETFKLTVTNTAGIDATGTATINDQGAGTWYTNGNPTGDTPATDGSATLDDDRPLTVSNVTVNENSPYAVFTVSGAANQVATLELTNVSTTGLATLQYFDGSTWQTYGSNVTLDGNGELLVRVAISPEQDSASDNNETFKLTATNTGGSSSYGTGTIKDDGNGGWFAAGNNTATSNVTGTLDDDSAVYIEQATNYVAMNSVDLSSWSGNFTGSYIEFDVSGRTNTESLGFVTSNTPSTSNGVITIVGSAVYQGNGTSASVVGQVDGTYNGQNGQKLRINFSVAFTNGNFANGTNGATVVDGWSFGSGKVVLGSTYIAGYRTPSTGLYSASSYHNINGNYGGGSTSGQVAQLSTANQSDDNTSATTSNDPDGADVAVYLSTGGMWINNGYGVVRGPYVVSDSTVTLAAGDSVKFDWKALAGGDAYAPYGYLLKIDGNTNSPTHIELLDTWGASYSSETGWATSTTTIGSGQGGEYKFVFIAGSYDRTGGRYVGGALMIDNVEVTQANPPSVTAPTLQAIANQITYTDTSDLSYNNALGSRTITINGTSDAGAQTQITQSFGKQEVNDPISLASVSSATYTDGLGNDTFTAATGTLSSSDADANTTPLYGIDGGTLSGATVTKVGSYGTLTLNSSTGAYTYTPDADAINALYSNASESFTFTVSDQNPTGAASTDSTVFNVNITATNDGPVAVTPALSASGAEDGATVSIDLKTGATDGEGDPLSITSITYKVDGVATGSSGSALPAGVSVSANNILTVDPTNSAFDYLAVGETQVIVATYVVEDEFGKSATQTATITINGVNDIPVITAFTNTGSVTEILGAGVGTTETNATGTITIQDLDDTNTVTLSSTYKNDMAWSRTGGTLTSTQINAIKAGFSLNSTSALPINDSTNKATSGWTYRTTEDLNFLRYGETITFSFDVEATDSSSAPTGSPETVTITIHGSAEPTSIADISVNEASPTAVFTVSGTAGDKVSLALATTGTGVGHAVLNTDTTTVNSVDLQYSEDNGSTWNDYTASSLVTLNNSGELLVRTGIDNETSNPIYEGAETFKLVATNENGVTNTVTSNNAGKATIYDDGSGTVFNNDGTANSSPTTDDDRPEYSINDVQVNEQTGSITFDVTRTGFTVFNSEVDYLLSEVAGSAQISPAGTNGIDVVQQNGTISFAANTAGANTVVTQVTATVADDSVFELEETFNAVISNPNDLGSALSAKLGSDSTGVGTIVDNDLPTDRLVVTDNVRVNEGSDTPDQSVGWAVFTIKSPTAWVGGLANKVTLDVVQGGHNLNASLGNAPAIQYLGSSNQGAVSGTTTWTTYSAGDEIALDTTNGELKVRVSITAEQDSFLDTGEKFDLKVTEVVRNGARSFAGDPVSTGTAIILDNAKGAVFDPNTGLPASSPTLSEDRDISVTDLSSEGLTNENSPYAMFVVNAARPEASGDAYYAVKLNVIDKAIDSINEEAELTSPSIEYSSDGSSWTTYDSSTGVVLPRSSLYGTADLYVRIDISSEADREYEQSERFSLKAEYDVNSAINDSDFTSIVDERNGDKYTGLIVGGRPHTTSIDLDDDRPGASAPGVDPPKPRKGLPEQNDDGPSDGYVLEAVKEAREALDANALADAMETDAQKQIDKLTGGIALYVLPAVESARSDTTKLFRKMEADDSNGFMGTKGARSSVFEGVGSSSPFVSDAESSMETGVYGEETEETEEIEEYPDSEFWGGNDLASAITAEHQNFTEQLDAASVVDRLVNLYTQKNDNRLEEQSSSESLI